MIAGAGVTLAIWTAAVQVASRAGILSVISLQSVLTALIMMGMAVPISTPLWGLSLMMPARLRWIQVKAQKECVVLRLVEACSATGAGALHAPQEAILFMMQAAGSATLLIRIAAARRGMCLMQINVNA
ncbi:hypothetical protein COV22_03230 [Candidatus Woesearchaeota archaeon CG10_big_fil_rev_8_21_14_0_10_47_5]|nr:MAG: hypothetical protein COV22_03230 [Candidatus Woesearchaeota archaeon CG10_big_fil_rev_8_21_14_0_10_47_5]